MEPVVETQGTPKPLSSIFGRHMSESDGGTPYPQDKTPEPEAAKVEDSAKPEEPVKAAETPTDTKPAEADGTKSEVKADAEVKTEEVKTEVKAEGDAKPGVDWESSDNPWKKKFEDSDKSWRDTRNWATQLQRENQSFRQQLDIINKKLDGTYDPAVDDPKPDPQAVIVQAEAKGKFAASLDAAYRQFGKDTVDKDIDRYNQLFENNESVQAQVWASPTPVFHALKMVRDFDISQKYGTTDVTELISKVEAETRAKVEKETEEKVTKRFMDGIAAKNKTPSGIKDVRAAIKTDDEKAPSQRPLSSYFRN